MSWLGKPSRFLLGALLLAVWGAAACGQDSNGTKAPGGHAGASTGAAGGAAQGASSSGGTAVAGATSAGTSSSSVAGGGTPTNAGSSNDTAGAAVVGGDGSGGAPEPTGQRCEPGTTNETPYAGVAGNCYNWSDSHQGIPNTLPISLRYIKLPTPTVVGQPYAISLGMAYGPTDATIELWGSSEACGDAKELLWWGSMRAGEICAEFKATQVHSHLLMVWRPHGRDLSAEHRSVTFCPTGSCGSAPDGHGLGIDPSPLAAPLGPILVNAGLSAGPLNAPAKVGYGWAHFKGKQSIALGGTATIDTGYFRLHATEGFDDAWYCPGPGSSLTWLETKRTHVNLAGITRVADCKNATGGTGTATFTTPAGAFGASMVSSVAELTEPNAQLSEGPCFKNAAKAPCRMSYKFSDARPNLVLHAFQSPTTRMQGQDLIQDFVDTALIVMPNDYGPPKIACAGQGSVTFAADGSVTVSLSQITTFNSCPGQALPDNTFAADFQFL